MNNIPPYSLTQNYISSAGNEFFSDYQALMSALVPSVTVDIQGDIGVAAYTAFLTYIQGLTPTPSVTQYPNIFLNWAFAHYPAVAVKGASDWSTMLLDPIGRAQMALMPYTSIGGSTAKAPDWSLGYPQLTSQLSSSPNKAFSETDVQSNSSVSNSWTSGGNSGFFGLWGSSESTSSQSQTFASQAVSLSVSFAHVTTFTPAPGGWYDSGALGLAFSTQTGKPWNPASAITWQKTFGSNGNMQRFASEHDCGLRAEHHRQIDLHLQRFGPDHHQQKLGRRPVAVLQHRQQQQHAHNPQLRVGECPVDYHHQRAGRSHRDRCDGSVGQPVPGACRRRPQHLPPAFHAVGRQGAGLTYPCP